MIEFKGVHHPKSAILGALFFYHRYAVSYCALEKTRSERGPAVDRATLNRRIVSFKPAIAARAKARKWADCHTAFS
ncbi:hypothetical protein [Solirhodobacter olei]|uniref:hypothetical protein n=1 Tax=Solirhodobacter olei TaxID=2493082 RepID=UPI000FD80038